MSEPKEIRSFIEIPLRDYANVEVQGLNRSLVKVGIRPLASIVFGSAVNQRSESESTRIDPARWDVDVLVIVDSISRLRERPSQQVQTDTERRYVCVVPPSNTVAELQEAGAMNIKSPRRGLHIQLVERSEFLHGKIGSMEQEAIATGVLLEGQIPDEIRSALIEQGIAMPKKPDEVIWSTLKYSTHNGRII